MNNLLRTLTESQVKFSSNTDLKLLLTTVKEARRQSCDAKLSDPFYDSLEGLLLDLRTITMDNRDAEAFLKPVSRADVPDYYDVISRPMDLQTMLKKVKQKQYKSKQEFMADLDLIWNNCFTYNATENHPLRLCATRLQAKSQKLIKYITDRKERMDPLIPSDLGRMQPKVNGLVNGYSNHCTPSSTLGTPIMKNLSKPRRNIDFGDTPAIIRTPSGMTTFLQLDREMDRATLSKSARNTGQIQLAQRLKDLIPPIECESDSDAVSSGGESLAMDGEIGEKRKLNGISDNRVRKRPRFTTQMQATDVDQDITDLWWQAVHSDTLMANGIPVIRYASSRQPSSIQKVPRKTTKAKCKKRKQSNKSVPPQKSLLTLMNNNIRTMKRVRRTHAKFAALNANVSNEDGEAYMAPPEALAGDEVDDVVDEQPWKARRSGIELGAENAEKCINWMGRKVLEHAGFQGTSKVALDVLAGVTSEYLLNVGRTIRFLCDKYSNSMTAEEIILHTLFESGTSKIQDLERYIKDDVIRYGSRLGDLEKKLVGAYREPTVDEALDDEALFRDEEDEDSAFVTGGFTESFGDDFFGLRDLGIAEELGLASLSVPKRLWTGKRKGENKNTSSTVNPAEPPPPFPPPPPFIPLNSTKVDDQIGLLKPLYQQRFAALSASTPAAVPPPPPSTTINANVGATALLSVPTAVTPAVSPPETAPIVLPDDQPNPLRIKMGPLGQITKGTSSANASKKKGKRKDMADGEAVVPSGPGPGEPAAKKKKTTGNPSGGAGGAGGGAKKKVKIAGPLPPVFAASTGLTVR